MLHGRSKTGVANRCRKLGLLLKRKAAAPPRIEASDGGGEAGEGGSRKHKRHRRSSAADEKKRPSSEPPSLAKIAPDVRKYLRRIVSVDGEDDEEGVSGGGPGSIPPEHTQVGWLIARLRSVASDRRINETKEKVRQSLTGLGWRVRLLAGTSRQAWLPPVHQQGIVNGCVLNCRSLRATSWPTRSKNRRIWT